MTGISADGGAPYVGVLDAALRRKPVVQRRIALILAEESGGGLSQDAAAKAITVLKALAAAGYRVDDVPAEGATLLAGLHSHQAREALLLPDYYAWFHSLPQSLRDKVDARWGAPERDRRFHKGELHCGEFAVSALRFGNVSIGMPPAAAGVADASEQVPPHGQLALYAWLQDGFRADAVIHMGATSGLGWCIEQALGPMPQFRA